MNSTLGRAIVARVNQAHPELLRTNTHPACGEFLQRVCAEPECKAERVGLLSKSPAENGYTYPNGIRTSHDVIAWPNGERVDIIQSAGAGPSPGGPTWQVTPPDQWRPSNVWVDISSWPIFDSGTGTAPPPTSLRIGFGWFCWMTAWAEWPSEAQVNYDWLKREAAPTLWRVMLCVEGRSHGTPDPWRDAAVLIDSRWEDRYKRMLDQTGNAGELLHCTVYGGRNQTPTHDDRRRFHDRIVAASQGRWPAIRSFEMMNEFKVNQWTAEEVRSAGRDLRSKLPSGFKLSLSSPALAHSYVDGRQPTNEEMGASFNELYSGDAGGANEITIHTMRDGGKWADPFAFNAFYGSMPKINNEPPGPGASAGAEETTAVDVARDVARTRDAEWPLYIGHAEWCPWNGHLPSTYHNGYREVRAVWTLPHMPACATVLRGSTPLPPEEPMIPYDEAKSVEFGEACNDVYKETPAQKDPGMVSVHSQRAAWDYYVGGLPWNESKTKHLNEFRAVYGLPPL